MTNRRAVLAVAGGFALLLSGCYDDITTTRYEAGVYKGSYDPLLHKLDSGDLHEELEERFRVAAQDR